MIEGYLPKAASEDEIRAVVQGAIAHLTQDGSQARPEGHGNGDEGRAAVAAWPMACEPTASW